MTSIRKRRKAIKRKYGIKTISYCIKLPKDIKFSLVVASLSPSSNCIKLPKDIKFSPTMRKIMRRKVTDLIYNRLKDYVHRQG